MACAALMAVLRDVDHDRLPPAEQEVAHPRAGCHGNAEVGVVGHEDEHQHVADDHLDYVQCRLQEVGGAQHPLSERTRVKGVETAVSLLARRKWGSIHLFTACSICFQLGPNILNS